MSPLDAAYLAFQNLSSYFSNSVPQFYFTLRDVNTGDLCHFRVNEIRSPQQLGNRIDYTITYLTDYQIPMQIKSAFLQKVALLNSRYMNLNSSTSTSSNTSSSVDDTTSVSSTTESDSYLYFVKNPSKPISHFWYNPLIYYQNLSDLKTFHTPSFISNMAPYVEIDLELIKNYLPQNL
jgi:hypothetical protein